MSILKINDIEVVDPSDMTVEIFDLSSSESGRTQSGKAVKDIVARKTKLNLKWNTLNWSDTSHLLTTVENSVYLRVRYPDPKLGTYVTKEMYVGDRSAPAVMLVNGKEFWSGISFELIER